MQTTFYVKSMKLAGYLMQQGFVLHGIKPNINSNRRNLFLFTNSPELLLAIEKYKNNKSLYNGVFISKKTEVLKIGASKQ